MCLANKTYPTNQPVRNEQIGFVYLIKSGRFYKIGKTNAPGRREYELAIQLPEKPRAIHVIRTDDPGGIEAYWHKRFEAKRKNGEWFDLSATDVAAFKTTQVHVDPNASCPFLIPNPQSLIPPLSPIRQLPQALVNKIAAGEVVERPASVVKELMENAVDAGATRIDVAVAQGGLEMIRVVDNGCGIPADELPLAVASHATSKLAEADDLFRVGTLGFRGEALASIAAVSRLVLRSRTAESPGGAEIEVTGGRCSDVTPCGCPVGTTVEVHNLFFNTPVRRKFLRTVQTEFGHTSEAFTRIALAAPQVHFTLRHNERPVLDLAAGDGLLERIARSFGRELAENLIAVSGSDGPVRISGYVAHPAHSRSNNRTQYFFLNGRHIRDPALQHALGEAYRGLLMTGRYAISFLSLEMPPEMVDVNVHPTKLEVRFQDSGRLYSQLLATLRRRFLTSDLSTHVQQAAGDDAAGGHDQAQTAQLRQEVVDWAKGKVAAWQPPGGAERPHREKSALIRPACRLQAGGRRWSCGRWGQVGRKPARQGPLEDNSSHVEEAGEISSPGHAPPAMQVHNRYLVTETSEGVTIIDQHALHERILYEQLRRGSTPAQWRRRPCWCPSRWT